MAYENLAVVRIDGGICSQIYFYAIGRALAARGAHVVYDLTWFRDYGKDVGGKFVRNWDFPKAFPSLTVAEATPAELLFVQTRHPCAAAVEMASPKLPAYVAGSDAGHASLVEAMTELRGSFAPVLSESDRSCLRRIAASVSCAVHVRRGDLSSYSKTYGSPTSVGYFEKSMKMVLGLAPRVRFFFFSDEPDWVRENVLPVLPSGVPFEVCAGNGSDRGYVDLYLISQCDFVVSSQGSLGVTAALLSPKRPVLFMSRNRPYVYGDLPSVVYVNDDATSVRSAVSSGCEISESGLLVRRDGFYRPLYKIWKHLGKMIARK